MKVVEKYLKSRPSSVFLTYYDISHEKMRKYENQSTKYIIFIGSHMIKKYWYSINGYNKDIRRMCTPILVLYISYGGNHLATLTFYILRYKAKVNIFKKKSIKKILKNSKAIITTS